MSLIKRFIEEQMELGNDVLDVRLKDEMLDAEYEEYLELSNCCGAKMAGEEYGIPSETCGGCGEHSVKNKNDK